MEVTNSACKNCHVNSTILVFNSVNVVNYCPLCGKILRPSAKKKSNELVHARSWDKIQGSPANTIELEIWPNGIQIGANERGDDIIVSVFYHKKRAGTLYIRPRTNKNKTKANIIDELIGELENMHDDCMGK